MCDQIEVLTNIIGMQAILQKCDLPFLRQVCNQMNLKSPDNKLQLIAVISTQSSVLTEAPPPPPKIRKPAPQPQVVTFSAVKLPISQNSTFQDIFQHYYQPELVQWCRDHGLKSTGSKPKLIHRILEYYGTSDPNAANHSSQNASGKQDSDTDEEQQQQQQQQQQPQEIQFQHAQPAEIVSMQLDQSIPSAQVHVLPNNNNNNNNNNTTTTTTTSTTSNNNSNINNNNNNNHHQPQHQTQPRPQQQQQQPQHLQQPPPPQPIQQEIQMTEAVEPPTKKPRIVTQEDIKALDEHRRKLLARRKEIMDILKRLDEITG